MKAQWQLKDISTGKAITIGNEIELVDFCERYFNEETTMTYKEARILFGDIDSASAHKPIGILTQKEKQ